ncbi:MAG TPA: TldD/PmbA family protein [bacterium]|nr:TldD/PmbA family protein [bacterium]
MDELDALERALRGMDVDGYEIYALENRQFSVEAKEGQIDSVDEAVERGAAVRLFKGRKTSFASSSGLSVPFLERMALLAYNTLSVVEEGPVIALPAARETAGPSQAAVSPGDRSVKLRMALDLEKFAKQYDRRVARVRDASYGEEVRTVTLRNSTGLETRWTAARHELSLMVMAEDAQGQEMAWENDFAADEARLDPERTAREGAEKAVSQLGGRPVATQKTPALLDATVAASFLGVLSSSFFGDQVLKSRSALCGRLGETIYGGGVTVVDDGRLEGGYNSFPFDGEGVTSARHAVVERGVLSRFLYDLASGVQAGVPSTGNAIRPAVKEPPRVGATNFFIEAGDLNLEELLRRLGTGLWVRDVIGVHTADPVTGDFSLGASGVWIDGGKRSFPVRGVTISGNLHDLLKRVTAVGKEMRRYHAFGAPPLLIESIDVGGI